MGFVGSLAVEIIGGIFTGAVLALVTTWVNAAQQVRVHDERIAELKEDNRRWFLDHDRSVDRAIIRRKDESFSGRTEEPSRYEFVAVELPVRRQALWDYRDEISMKRRRYREIRAAEGKLHALVRKRNARPLPRFELTDAQRRQLTRWRHKDIFDDPTSVELEPDLRRFEAEGDPPLSAK